jgi:putative membrane protein insertion efficiency factor
MTARAAEDRPLLSRGLVALLVLPIRLYQRLLSPLLGAHCRFAPSCSAYAVTALQQHGVLRGGLLAVRRIGRCHPWNAGGHEPVPPARASRTTPDPGRRPDAGRPIAPAGAGAPS